jgi:hypothetical protein
MSIIYTQEDCLDAYRDGSATRQDILDETLNNQIKIFTERAAAAVQAGMPVEVTLYNEIKNALLLGIAMGEASKKFS